MHPYCDAQIAQTEMSQEKGLSVCSTSLELPAGFVPELGLAFLSLPGFQVSQGLTEVFPFSGPGARLGLRCHIPAIFLL